MQVIFDQGKGRGFVIFSDQGSAFAQKIAESLAEKGRTVLICLTASQLIAWRQTREEIVQLLSKLGIRQASYVGIEAQGVAPLALALSDLKLLRSLVLVNPQTRPAPSFRDKMISKVEEYLPLGLPFRGSTSGFDCKPFLQRIRCPVLLIQTLEASAYQCQQLELFSKELPTAWSIKLRSQLSSAQGIKEFCELALELQDVPAKCPQKSAA